MVYRLLYKTHFGYCSKYFGLKMSILIMKVGDAVLYLIINFDPYFFDIMNQN